ncbi:hypothetical protein AA11826_1227 [Komagataeibacter oboediens DSM 11826]|uniref:DUF192 domain-containing protein n=1 Tax=Komagataeibacter oboediens TaxID=65958 RepID=A0A318R2L3_9PROT|nr:DUF192 domain-containing protein [Komagataeibacter oboediens]PYD82239.1 hypothetical protein CFR80_07120 [Komagataeibacter oboediens]GBR34483.1 hypothetical protein AA11826_1227 [Komagataeibacter oboediens DSM 11826]
MMSFKAGRWLALAACMAAVSVPVMAAEETGEPTHAQAALPTVPLTITSADGVRHVFTVEKAMTPREQQVGEMYRPSVPADGGMIFVWPFPRQSDMWMQHTQASLDIVFIGPDNRVSSIVENAVPLSLARISSHGRVRATLELQAGITEKLGIVVGDRVDSVVLNTGSSPK